MSKAIKIIDLLNKIANGERVPEQIKYNTFNWDYYKDEDGIVGYMNDANRDLFNEYLDTCLIDSLNDEVEIIEDQIDIQNIEEIGNTTFDLDNMEDDEIEKYHNFTRTKINELIQAVKQLNKKMEDKNK